MSFDWYQRHRIVGALSDAAGELVGRVQSSPVDDRFKSILTAAVNAAGFVLVDVGVIACHFDGAWHDWSKRLRTPAAALASLRVLTWAAVADQIALTWPDRWARVVEVASAALAIESEHERAIADFGPLGGGCQDHDGEWFTFNRVVWQSLLGAGLGSDVDRGDTLVMLAAMPSLLGDLAGEMRDVLDALEGPD